MDELKELEIHFSATYKVNNEYINTYLGKKIIKDINLIKEITTRDNALKFEIRRIKNDKQYIYNL